MIVVAPKSQTFVTDYEIITAVELLVESGEKKKTVPQFFFFGAAPRGGGFSPAGGGGGGAPPFVDSGPRDGAAAVSSRLLAAAWSVRLFRVQARGEVWRRGRRQ